MNSSRAAYITFAEFHTGMALGKSTQVLGQELLDSWYRIYGSGGSARFVPTALIMVLIMRSYMEAVGPRPPGNIHAGQSLSVHGSIGIGDEIETSFSCGSKEHKRHHFVTLDTRSVRLSDNSLIATGAMTMIWAQ